VHEDLVKGKIEQKEMEEIWGILGEREGLKLRGGEVNVGDCIAEI